MAAGICWPFRVELMRPVRLYIHPEPHRWESAPGGQLHRLAPVKARLRAVALFLGYYSLQTGVTLWAANHVFEVVLFGCRHYFVLLKS